MNYGAHSKFVTRWLEKLEAEDAGVEVSAADPTGPDTTEHSQVAEATETQRSSS